jgi:hypothetical protein
VLPPSLHKLKLGLLNETGSFLFRIDDSRTWTEVYYEVGYQSYLFHNKHASGISIGNNITGTKLTIPYDYNQDRYHEEIFSCILNTGICHPTGIEY